MWALKRCCPLKVELLLISNPINHEGPVTLMWKIPGNDKSVCCTLHMMKQELFFASQTNLTIFLCFYVPHGVYERVRLKMQTGERQSQQASLPTLIKICTDYHYGLCSWISFSLDVPFSWNCTVTLQLSKYAQTMVCVHKLVWSQLDQTTTYWAKLYKLYLLSITAVILKFNHGNGIWNWYENV